MVVLGLAGPEGVSLKTGWLWASVPGFSRPQGLSPWRGFTARPERCQCARAHPQRQLRCLSQGIQTPRHQELWLLGVSGFSSKSLSGPILCYICPFGKGHLELCEVRFGRRNRKEGVLLLRVRPVLCRTSCSMPPACALTSGSCSSAWGITSSTCAAGSPTPSRCSR